MATTQDRIRKKLNDRLNQLIVKTQSDVDDLPAAEGDIIDVAFATGSAAIMSALAEHEADEAIQIREALSCMDDGTYGVCLCCQKKIPSTRLQALPHTRCCVTCQQSDENNTAKNHMRER